MERQLIPYISPQKLMNLKVGVYEFNLENPKDFFINDTILAMLGDINKIFNTSPFDAMSRLLHPDDLAGGFKGYEYQQKHPYYVYTNFKRIRTNENEYDWILSVTGTLGFNKEQRPVKFRGVSTRLDLSEEHIIEVVNSIQEAGIVLNSEDIDHQLGLDVSGFVNQYFNITHPIVPIDFLKQVREGLNCPKDISNNVLFYLIKELFHTKKSPVFHK